MLMCRYRFEGTYLYVAFALCKKEGEWIFSHMGPGQMMTEKAFVDIGEAVSLALDYVESMRPRS